MSTRERDDHVASLEVFAKDVEEAVRSAYPSGVQPYTKVEALFLWWHKCDIDIHPAIEHLRRTLTMIYGFGVDKYEFSADLPSNAAEKTATAYLRKWTEKHDSPNTLLIVIYNGHATGKPDECKLKGTLGSNTQIDWFRMSGALHTTDYAHVLVILDCCYAAVSGIEAQIEILAACSREGIASSDSVFNLTTIFSKILAEQAGSLLSVAFIHGLMVRDVRKNGLSPTPVHVVLGDKLRVNGSIRLGRLGKVAVEQFLPKTATVRITMTAELDDPNILPSPTEWANFFTSLVPSNVKKICAIHAEAVYKTDSITVEFSGPLEVWSMLRWIGPYKLGRFVRSRNLLLPGTSRTEQDATGPVQRATEEPSSGPSSMVVLTNRELKKGGGRKG